MSEQHFLHGSDSRHADHSRDSSHGGNALAVQRRRRRSVGRRRFPLCGGRHCPVAPAEAFLRPDGTRPPFPCGRGWTRDGRQPARRRLSAYCTRISAYNTRIPAYSTRISAYRTRIPAYRTRIPASLLPHRSVGAMCLCAAPQPPAANARTSRFESLSISSACRPQLSAPLALRAPAQCTR